MSFGSALRLEGVEAFLQVLSDYAPVPGPEEYPPEFGARVFKITRDEQGNRLTWMKVTGGVLKVKMALPQGRGRDEVLADAGETERADSKEAERADQIRLYSGSKFTPLKEAEAGMVVGGRDGGRCDRTGEHPGGSGAWF